MYSGEVTLTTAGSDLIQITLNSHEVVGSSMNSNKIEELLDVQISGQRCVYNLVRLLLMLFVLLIYDLK